MYSNQLPPSLVRLVADLAQRVRFILSPRLETRHASPNFHWLARCVSTVLFAVLQLAPPQVNAIEYVSARIQYGPVIGCCYVWREDMASAQALQAENVCKNLKAFNCVTSIVGPQRWHMSKQWMVPTVTTYDKLDSAGNPVHGSTSNYIYILYSCPVSWTATWLEAAQTYRCSRDVPKVDCSECKNKSNEPPANVGNPINVIQRAKIQAEVDYTNVSGSLSYVRTYQSDTGQWVDNWTAGLVDWNSSQQQVQWACYYDSYDPSHYCYRYTTVPKPYNLELRRGQSPAIAFDSDADLKPSRDVDDRVSSVTSPDGALLGWSVHNATRDSTEFYRLDGRLNSLIGRNGQVTRLFYSDASTPNTVAPVAGLLIRVEDQFGNALRFRYNEKQQVAALVDPDGHETIYTYDANGLLTSVTYPGGKTRTYLYSEAEHVAGGAMPRTLTGIIDENLDRYATFKYSGKVAYSTSHGSGVNEYVVTTADSKRYVVDPLGRSTVYTFRNFSAPRTTTKISAISRPSASGSGAVSATWTYDTQLNVQSRKDFNGSVTNFTYDLARNLETVRVEAVGTVDARTITTEWHAAFRLPVKIAEPKRLTTFNYDTQGRMLTRTEQATLDSNGTQGLAATVVGKPRVWSWTYNQFGQISSITGPRTDVVDTTTFSYDAAGNLATETNALGQQTTYLGYDGSGRVGRIVQPNGLVTAFTYTPRGWLASRTVTDGSSTETTTFDYDAVGQLKKVSFPDTSWVAYTYDSAHRLTNIVDSAGNSVLYTLDNAGNRTGEKVVDPAGALTRQITRVYDTLSNLKQVTGAMQ